MNGPPAPPFVLQCTMPSAGATRTGRPAPQRASLGPSAGAKLLVEQAQRARCEQRVGAPRTAAPPARWRACCCLPPMPCLERATNIARVLCPRPSSHAPTCLRRLCPGSKTEQCVAQGTVQWCPAFTRPRQRQRVVPPAAFVRRACEVAVNFRAAELSRRLLGSRFTKPRDTHAAAAKMRGKKHFSNA